MSKSQIHDPHAKGIVALVSEYNRQQVNVEKLAKEHENAQEKVKQIERHLREAQQSLIGSAQRLDTGKQALDDVQLSLDTLRQSQAAWREAKGLPPVEEPAPIKPEATGVLAPNPGKQPS